MTDRHPPSGMALRVRLDPDHHGYEEQVVGWVSDRAPQDWPEYVRADVSDRYLHAVETLAEATGKLVYEVGLMKPLAWPERAKIDAALNEAGYALRAYRQVEKDMTDD